MEATTLSTTRDPRPRTLELKLRERAITVAIAALMAFHGVICWLSRPPGFLTGQDDVEYTVLGQSLRHLGYSLTFRVDAPVHSQYPPGYPAMIGIWGGVFGDGFDSLVLISILASAALIGIVFVGVRRIAGPVLALTVAFVLAVNPSLLRAGSAVASEAPFTMLSTLSVVLLANRKRSARVAGLACAAAILAALTRSVGVALLAAVGMYWLIERRWKTLALFVLACALTVGSWLLWTAFAPEQFLGMSYIADLKAATRTGLVTMPVLRRLMQYVNYYATDAVPWSLGTPSVSGTIVDNLVAVTVLYSGLLAGLLVMAKRWRSAALYLLFYFALLALWRWRNARFVLPMVPLLMAAIFIGWHAMLRNAPARVRQIGMATLSGVLLLGGAARTAGIVGMALPCRAVDGWPPNACMTQANQGYFNALRYIDSNLPADAVLLTAKSGALWQYTGRRTISYGGALAQDTARFVPFLRESGAGWVLIAGLENAETTGLARRLQHSCSELSPIVSFPPLTYLFRIKAPGEAGDDGCAAMNEYRERIPPVADPR